MHHRPWVHTGAFLDILWLHCVVMIGPQDDPHFLPVLQQITDEVDVGVHQHTTLVLDLASCRVAQPASSPLSSPRG